jgi:hypothetical protein
MKFLPFIANIFIVGLFLYSKLLPHKDKLNLKYRGVFTFFQRVFSPVFNFLSRFFKPVQVGVGLSIDMTQIILLVILLIIGNF